MEYVLRMEGRSVRLSYDEDVDFAEAKDPNERCPHCNEPLRVSGDGYRVVDDRVYAATGYCRSCYDRVGEIRANPGTFFGIEEDRRMAEVVKQMGIKVY